VTFHRGRDHSEDEFLLQGQPLQKKITRSFFLRGVIVPYNGIQRRKHQRYDFCSKIDYVLTQGDTEEIFKGVTINISPFGLRLYMFTPHREGEGIKIRSKLPVDSQTATICWINKCGSDLYAVGLKYTDSIDTQ